MADETTETRETPDGGTETTKTSYSETSPNGMGRESVETNMTVEKTMATTEANQI